MVGKIEPRYGAEVYISETGNLCIKQEQEGSTQLLMFAEGEIDGLIELLNDAKQEFLDDRQAAEENENN